MSVTNGKNATKKTASKNALRKTVSKVASVHCMKVVRRVKTTASRTPSEEKRVAVKKRKTPTIQKSSTTVKESKKKSSTTLKEPSTTLKKSSATLKKSSTTLKKSNAKNRVLKVTEAKLESPKPQTQPSPMKLQTAGPVKPVKRVVIGGFTVLTGTAVNPRTMTRPLKSILKPSTESRVKTPQRATEGKPSDLSIEKSTNKLVLKKKTKSTWKNVTVEKNVLGPRKTTLDSYDIN